MNTKQEASLRRLGQADIQVRPIGLGVMQFSGSGKGLPTSYQHVGRDRVSIYGGVVPP